MSLEHIWSGWRAAYVTGATGEQDGAGEGCLFCGLAELDDTEAYILERGTDTFTVLNAYPYTSGHVMVAPFRHTADVEALTTAEGAAMFAALQRAVTAMKKAFSAEGINIGANLGRVAGAGVPGHVHVHALPRWAGDTNFMTTIADARVLPEDLRTTWEKLRDAWPE